MQEDISRWDAGGDSSDELTSSVDRDGGDGRPQERAGLSARDRLAVGEDVLSVIADGGLVSGFLDHTEERLGHADPRAAAALRRLARFRIEHDRAGAVPGAQINISDTSGEQVRAWRQALRNKLARGTVHDYVSCVGWFWVWLYALGVVSARAALVAGADPLSLIADRRHVHEFSAVDRGQGDVYRVPVSLRHLARWLIENDPAAEQPIDPAGGEPGGQVWLSRATPEQLRAWRIHVRRSLARSTAKKYVFWVARFYASLYDQGIVGADLEHAVRGRD